MTQINDFPIQADPGSTLPNGDSSATTLSTLFGIVSGITSQISISKILSLLDLSSYATKTYVDNLASGVLKMRGVYDASSNLYPSTGGSGVDGEIKNNDAWLVSAPGILGGHPVVKGDLVFATADIPGQTEASWGILERNLDYIPESEANRTDNIIDFLTSSIKYWSVKGVVDYVASKFAIELTATAAGTTTLTATSKPVQVFTGTLTQDVVMPVVTTLRVGWTVEIINESSDAVTVKSSGLNVVCVVGASQRAILRVSSIAEDTTAAPFIKTVRNDCTDMRIVSITSSATPTINTNNCDYFVISALAVDITGFTVTGDLTANRKRGFFVEITATATKSITWGPDFEYSTKLLPTTVGTTKTTVGFIWNDVTSKYTCIGVS